MTSWLVGFVVIDTVIAVTSVRGCVAKPCVFLIVMTLIIHVFQKIKKALLVCPKTPAWVFYR
jgi:hypothetical protein